MNTKTIVISIIVLIVLAVGGYFIYQSMSNTSSGGIQPTGDIPSDQVQGQDVAVGTGAEATPGSQVSVLYTGKLTDGTVFDSSAAHNNEPLVFVLGTEGLIPGFQIGVNGMREGGKRLLAIPSALAYGDQDVKDASGKVIIPANSTLVFEVELVKVEAAPANPAETQ